MKKFTLLMTSALLFSGVANAANIQVNGEFTEDKKGKVKVEGFKPCSDRSPSKRREGMGHSDLPHGTMCMGGDNCTLSILSLKARLYLSNTTRWMLMVNVCKKRPIFEML